jgi:hypothetical protein
LQTFEASPNIHPRKEKGKQKIEKRKRNKSEKEGEEGGRGAFYVLADPGITWFIVNDY